MAEKNQFNPNCIEALYRKQLTLPQALGFVDDLEVIRLFESLCKTETFLQLVEQTGSSPANFEEAYRGIRHLKSMAAAEFFYRTEI